jgi:hypothetical protein
MSTRSGDQFKNLTAVVAFAEVLRLEVALAYWIHRTKIWSNQACSLAGTVPPAANTYRTWSRLAPRSPSRMDCGGPWCKTPRGMQLWSGLPRGRLSRACLLILREAAGGRRTPSSVLTESKVVVTASWSQDRVLGALSASLTQSLALTSRFPRLRPSLVPQAQGLEDNGLHSAAGRHSGSLTDSLMISPAYYGHRRHTAGPRSHGPVRLGNLRADNATAGQGDCWTRLDGNHDCRFSAFSSNPTSNEPY